MVANISRWSRTRHVVHQHPAWADIVAYLCQRWIPLHEGHMMVATGIGALPRLQVPIRQKCSSIGYASFGGMRSAALHAFITPFAEVGWGMTPRPASWLMGGV
jgi:hypothetical protein